MSSNGGTCGRRGAVVEFCLRVSPPVEAAREGSHRYECHYCCYDGSLVIGTCQPQALLHGERFGRPPSKRSHRWLAASTALLRCLDGVLGAAIRRTALQAAKRSGGFVSSAPSYLRCERAPEPARVGTCSYSMIATPRAG